VFSFGSLTVHALFIITDATFQGPEKEEVKKTRFFVKKKSFC
jgi:hypothetical protein